MMFLRRWFVGDIQDSARNGAMLAFGYNAQVTMHRTKPRCLAIAEAMDVDPPSHSWRWQRSILEEFGSSY